MTMRPIAAPPAAPRTASVPAAREYWASRELIIVREFSRLAGHGFDPAYAIRSMLHLLSELLGLNRGRVLLAEEDGDGQNGGRIAIQFAYGLTPEEIRRGVFAPGEGITGRSFKTGAVLIVQDIDDEPLYLARTVARADLPQETVAYLAQPILMDGKVCGVLGAHRLRSRNRALADDVQILQIVATFIAQLLRGQRAPQEVEQEAEQQATALMSVPAPTPSTRIEQDYARDSPVYGIVGQSGVLHAALRQIEQVAQTDATVLLLGESGTGKELFARALHLASPRRDGPFVRVNCGAIPETLFESELFGHEKGAFTGAQSQRKGRFELAEGGTLLLDEISDLPMAMQVKLLRVLQEQTIERLGSQRALRINVRIVAATNQDLQQLVAQGRFRLDLFYRLNVIPVRLPALRERPEDIRPLARHMLEQVNRNYRRKISIAHAALDRLAAYHWPGNVRQLGNIVERLALLCTGLQIDAASVTRALAAETASEERVAGTSAAGGEAAPLASASDAGSMPPAVRGYHSVDGSERVQIIDALHWSGGNRSRAAQRLGMTLRQLSYRIKLLQIDVPGKISHDTRTIHPSA